MERATRATAPFVARVLRHRRRLKEGVVAAVAFGLLTAAAFTWHPWSGLVAAGVSVLLVDYAVESADGEASP
jgi:hypothetical protein